MGHGLFMFSACYLGFPQHKGVIFFAQCLTNSFEH